MATDIFTQASHQKKASYVPVVVGIKKAKGAREVCNKENN